MRSQQHLSNLSQAMVSQTWNFILVSNVTSIYALAMAELNLNQLEPHVQILLYGNTLILTDQQGNALGVDQSTLNDWKHGKLPRPEKARFAAQKLCAVIKDKPTAADAILKFVKRIAATHAKGENIDTITVELIPGFVYRLASNMTLSADPTEKQAHQKKNGRSLKKTGARTVKARPSRSTKTTVRRMGEPPEPDEHGYRTPPLPYEKVQMYREKWLAKQPIRKVIMLHLNGGVFRVQRLQWQVEFANKHLPADYLWPDKVFSESPVERDRRLAIELEGAEPWPVELESVSVFMGSELSFRRWIEPPDRGMIETPETARLFWVEYLRKLKTSFDRLRMDSRFQVSLHQVQIQDFYAHFFNYDQPGGHIVGTNLWGGRDGFPLEAIWPLNKPEPASFAKLKRRLEKIRTDRETCDEIPLT